MKVFYAKSKLIPFLASERAKGKTSGLVPTMGALHEGHLALVKASVSETDLSLSSIFVNPAQFNNPEDLLSYPRSLEEDLEKLKNAGCDVVYVPTEEDMYDPFREPGFRFDFGELERILEGRYRPGHFNGVALVVAKLFNITQPDFAFFGQKDLQQFHVVSTLVRDLTYNIQLRCIPTIREKDGLAMSSRNRRIPLKLRPVANIFYRSLNAARDMLRNGKSIQETRLQIHNLFRKEPEVDLEYFEVVDTAEFTIIENIRNENKTALCIAGYLNNIRLIDNVMYI